MTDQTQTNAPESNLPKAPEISDPNISFADFETLRRGGKVEGSQSAPAEKHEQKVSGNSESPETEADDESDELDASDKDAENESDKDKPKKKGGFQRRIEKLNARYADKEREAEFWKSEALKKAEAQKTEQPKVDKKSVSDGEPNPEDFETHREYQKALTTWMLDQRDKERSAQDEKKNLMSEHERAIKSHQERVKEFIGKHDDWDEVMAEVSDIRPTPALEQLIVESENGPALMYELAKKREDLEKIIKMPPLAAARFMGQIEARLQSKASEAKQETKKLTNAPKPIDPIGGSAKGSVKKSIDDPDISFADFERLRREQMKRRQ